MHFGNNCPEDIVMKIKDGYILREVAGSNIIVAVGDESVNFDGIRTINETGAFLWKNLEKGTDEVELVSALMEEYEVDEETAKTDVAEFVNLLINNGLISNE